MNYRRLSTAEDSFAVSLLQPMAVVSWGCVLRVKWVESTGIKKWVESHALHTPQAADYINDGTYDEGMHNYMLGQTALFLFFGKVILIVCLAFALRQPLYTYCS